MDAQSPETTSPETISPETISPETIGLALPPLIRLRAHLHAIDPIHLPPYPGSAWRGLLGHGLRQAACVTRARTCEACLLASHCVYTRVFEPPAPTGEAGRRFAAPPRPYILNIDPRAPRDYASSQPLTLGLTLLGEAIRQVPYLIHALQQAGQRGLGREQARFAVTSLDQETAAGSGDWRRVYEADTGRYAPLPLTTANPPPPPSQVRVSLLTPLRLKRHDHLTRPEDFNAQDLLFNLVGRLGLLASHHGGDPAPLDWSRYYQAAAMIRLAQARLHWHEWTRYSSRQSTLMELGGLLGTFALAGEGLASLWPPLWQGQWVHAGKGTTFGLGAYRLEIGFVS